MKMVCYILSLSLLLLGSLPCAEAAVESSCTETCEQEAESHAADTEACSSLCPCACMGCHGFPVGMPFSCPLPEPTYHITNPETYYSGWQQDFNPLIWQPPQLS